MKDQMDAGTGAPGDNKVAPAIDELIARYEMANLADGKSPNTIRWYEDILKAFLGYQKSKKATLDLSGFDIDAV